VARISAQVDGIPLALELAAARLRVFSPDQIAALLEDHLGWPMGSRTGPPRQQTLEAAIAWSYELLTEDERRLFERVSVFAGGWSLEAA
jgi:predicted ATPase